MPHVQASKGAGDLSIVEIHVDATQLNELGKLPQNDG